MKSTICKRCGEAFDYEPVVWNGKEWPAPDICSEYCEDTLGLDGNDGDKLEPRLEAWKRACPPLFLDTDTNHPDFPFGRAERALSWPYGPKGLLLHGITARCKTRVLYLILQRLAVEDGLDVAVYPPGKLDVDMTESYQRNAYPAFYRRLARAEVLAIDDLGKDKFTERFESLIFNVFNERFEHCRPVLVTTNFVGIPDGGRQRGVTYLEDRFHDQDKAIPFVRRLREFCEPVAF